LNSLSISWRDLVAPAIIFVVIVALFGGLSTQAGWPSATEGWSLVVAIAAAVAFAPVVARALNFLQQSRASIEGPFGLKLNFASAVERSETKVGWLSVGTVQQGTLLPESGRGQLEQAAIDAKKHRELVIDLEDGSAWYLTRLFAVAATAVQLGSPTLLVLVGQKGTRAKQAGGSIAPGDLVRAISQRDSRYAKLWRHTQEYIEQLHAARISQKLVARPSHPKLQQYSYLYEEIGDAVVMRVLVEQLILPDPGVLSPTDQPPEAGPPWVTLSDLQQWLGPWLGSDLVEMGAPAKEQVAAILNAKGDVALAVRDGTFEGIIDVGRAGRHILSQLAERAGAAPGEAI